MVANLLSNGLLRGAAAVLLAAVAVSACWGAVEETGEAGPPPTDLVAPTPAVEPTTMGEPATADEPILAVEPATTDELEEALAEFLDQDVSPPKPKMLRFEFRFQPWTDVLEWFADQADLSLVLDAPPPGTFNYRDDRLYTPAEAIDLLNSVLLTKGYTLVRRERMLMLINLEDGIPPNLVSTVPEEELDQRGEYELVSVLFQLDKFEPEEAEQEIQKLIGPQGTVVMLAKTKQILVTETAGRLRTIREVIRRVEDPAGILSGKLVAHELNHILPEEAMGVLRQLLDIPADAHASEDGTIRVAMDPVGTKLFFWGNSQKVAQARMILETIDVGMGGEFGEEGAVESLQVEVYPITVADPESVLQVAQTLLAGLPGVRLSLDQKTDSLVALARPAEHATIVATLAQMQSDIRRIEMIRLRTVDPRLAMLSIQKMFGEAGEENTTAPTVDADLVSRQLLVHGTETQISQIRVLLEKMGERGTSDGYEDKVRMVPITGRNAEIVLDRVRQLWPTIRTNPIREVTPSALIPSMVPGETIPSRVPSSSNRPQSVPPARDSFRQDTGAQHPAASRFRFASQDGAEASSDQPQSGPSADAEASRSPSDEPGADSPIVVSVGPGGIMIASDDTEALAAFEELLNSLSGAANAEATQLTIFYLKHAKAATVAETLTQIIGGGSAASTTTTADDSTMLGKLGGASLGGSSSLGTLLGLSSTTISPTGSLRITPEPRLNALIVEANQTDLRTIEAVLKILDRTASPEEILVEPRPRLIPVLNTQAEEIAEIVKEIYKDRLSTGGSSGGRGGGISPQQIIEAMRRGRDRGSSSGSQSEDVAKMSIGVDARTNSIIVSAAEALFDEVRTLIEELDEAAALSADETMRVVSLDRLNPEAMQKALAAIVGENAIVGSSASKPKARASNASGRSSQSSPFGGASADSIRRRIEMFRAMQGGGRPGGGGGGRSSARPSGGTQRPSGTQRSGGAPTRRAPTGR